MIERLASGVMVRPEDIRPSRPDFKVIGTFNPGAVRWHDTTTLLVRVVEAPADVPAGHMAFPRWDFASDKPELVVDTLSMDAVDTADHRTYQQYADSADAPVSLTLDDGRARVRFASPQRAVAPGQAVVFYAGDRVLGGGIIESAGTAGEQLDGNTPG